MRESESWRETRGSGRVRALMGHAKCAVRQWPKKLSKVGLALLINLQASEIIDRVLISISHFEQIRDSEYATELDHVITVL